MAKKINAPSADAASMQDEGNLKWLFFITLLNYLLILLIIFFFRCCWRSEELGPCLDSRSRLDIYMAYMPPSNKIYAIYVIKLSHSIITVFAFHNKVCTVACHFLHCFIVKDNCSSQSMNYVIVWITRSVTCTFASLDLLHIL